MNFEKLLGKKAFNIHFNLLQVCPSVPPFVFAVLFILSFYVLWCYFYVSLSLVAVPLFELWLISWHSAFKTLIMQYYFVLLLSMV